jgi:hypothetical protein
MLAGLIKSDPDYDPWVEKTSLKLQKLSPQLRSIADGLIDSLIEQEKINEKPKTKPRSART